MPPIPVEVEMVERRLEPDLAAIWELLREVDMKVSNHISESEVTRPKIDELLSVFSQAKGAITFIKWMAALTSMGVALWSWASTHLIWKGF